jgi:hypothetical protein
MRSPPLNLISLTFNLTLVIVDVNRVRTTVVPVKFAVFLVTTVRLPVNDPIVAPASLDLGVILIISERNARS